MVIRGLRGGGELWQDRRMKAAALLAWISRIGLVGLILFVGLFGWWRYQSGKATASNSADREARIQAAVRKSTMKADLRSWLGLEDRELDAMSQEDLARRWQAAQARRDAERQAELAR